MAWLIVGLGNPSAQYEGTRHNAGFMAMDAIAANFQLSTFNFQSKLNAQTSKGKIGDQNVILAKPQTFMNNSGLAVDKLIKNLKLGIKNLIVLHDDIDIPLGEIKVSRGSGSAGHKGVESVIRQLGAKDFTRIRIGIQPEEGKPEETEEFVLKRFSRKENKFVEHTIQNSCEALQYKMQEGHEPAKKNRN